MENIKYEDFAKIDLRVGVVREAALHPDADKLLILQVDLGEEEPRQIVAGIRKEYSPELIVGMSIIVVANLEPRKLRGVESHGMLLAAKGPMNFEHMPGEVMALLTISPGCLAAGSKVG